MEMERIRSVARGTPPGWTAKETSAIMCVMEEIVAVSEKNVMRMKAVVKEPVTSENDYG
jgi:hypothetical protein